ncbi:MAG: hypothetical protein AB8G22_11810 [Saprospiraceae bacterium]
MSNIICNDNNTPSTNLDDRFSFDLNIAGISNESWTAYTSNGVIGSGAYGELISVGSFAIEEGTLAVFIQDNQTTQFIDTVLVTPPFSCSDCAENVQLSLCEGDAATIHIDTSETSYPYLQWYRDGLPIVGQQADSITLSEAGSYYLRASEEMDFACYHNLVNPITVTVHSNPVAADHYFSFCPSDDFSADIWTRENGIDEVFNIVETTTAGSLALTPAGEFTYQNLNYACTTDSFTYEVCNSLTNCCTTGTVRLRIGDDESPILLNVPEDITLSCNEEIPEAINVFAIDNCSGITVELQELTIGNACESFLTREWTATDLCGNSTVQRQTITKMDLEAPVIHRIHELAGGQQVVAGQVEIIRQYWKTIQFPTPFTERPVVLAQRVGAALAPEVIQIREVTTTQFTVRIQAEEQVGEANRDIQLNWIAIATGGSNAYQQVLADKAFLDTDWQSINFPTNFETNPLIFGQSQSTIESDPVTIRYRNSNPTGVELQLQEEQSLDAEVEHFTEELGYLALTEGAFYNNSGEQIGESGSVLLGSEWVSISSTLNYHNPIVVLGTAATDDTTPLLTEVRQISNSVFAFRLSTYAYQSGQNIEEQSIPYLILEGSLPLVTNNSCEERWLTAEGSDIMAVDNCQTVTLDVEATTINNDAVTASVIREWIAEDACGIQTSYRLVESCPYAAVRVKALLQGALLNNSNSFLMRDDLRKLELIPTKEPYTSLFNLSANEPVEESTDLSQLFTVEGNDAIVDWVLIELRSIANPKIVIASKKVLLQRDGDVIDIAGQTRLNFYHVPAGDYYISVSHRNHLGVLSATPITLDAGNIPMVDFTKGNAFGAHPMVQVGERFALWAGDANMNKSVIYQGPSNDVYYILYQVFDSIENTEFAANYIKPGYYSSDINLDGRTIYQGPDNERAEILFSIILAHPDNINAFPNYIIQRPW